MLETQNLSTTQNGWSSRSAAEKAPMRITTQELKALYPESDPVSRPYAISIGSNQVFFELQNNLFEPNSFQVTKTAPYPLDPDTVSKSGYQRRPNVERIIVEEIQNSIDGSYLRLIGPEGSG